MSGAPLRLHRNEGRPPGAESFVRLLDVAPELANRYPEEESGLRMSLARRLGLLEENLWITAGGDDSIDRFFRVWAGSDSSLVVPEPTFQMIPKYARMGGAQVRFVSDMWRSFPLDAVLAAIDGSTRVAAIVTPNNPSGAVATEDDVRAVSSALGPDGMLLLDCAYAEFADNDLTRLAIHLPNVVAIRTMSKAWGLAGLRVGYAVSRPEHIQRLSAMGSPYPVSTLSLSLAKREIETGEARMRGCVAQVRDERTRLKALFERLGLEALPSQANFVFVKTRKAQWLEQALSALSVVVRVVEGWPPDGIRITCPANEDDFQRLESALESVLAPAAILFDMDGVLADVSNSYRSAIHQTVNSFGGQVTNTEIDLLKAAGDSNDDWILSQRILAESGIDVPLRKVIERFEDFYQGSEEEPGLRSTEQLLASREWLRSLSKRFSLGVVTGRPRVDAERFLSEQGIASYFSAVVVREDGASKPDPAPVRLALERLGVSSAWMLGDTPDDIIAAREAGVVPVAMVPPGAGPELEAGLRAAAPALVIESPDQIEGSLS